MNDAVCDFVNAINEVSSSLLKKKRRVNIKPNITW